MALITSGLLTRTETTGHHDGDEGELDSFARDVEKIVREARGVYGEFAPYDGGTYTFIADYLPWNNGDGMEHRNSTVITSSSAVGRPRLDDTIAHEFFHCWNVERIRPKSLEPFDFDRANISGDTSGLTDGARVRVVGEDELRHGAGEFHHHI